MGNLPTETGCISHADVRRCPTDAPPDGDYLADVTAERQADVGPVPSAGRIADGPDATGVPGSRLRHLAASLLRIPLFYKILLANAGAVALAAGFGAWLTATRGLGRSGDLGALQAALLIATIGALASALVHVFLLRRALSPLRELDRVASRLRDDDPDSELRARVPATADRNLADLIRVFNGMLDTMADYRSRLRRLTARTLEAAEEERKLVAGRLQEDVAQRLASLMVRLQLARRSGDPVRRDAAMEQLREEVALALETVRGTARSLHPPELDDIGLGRALRSLARSLADPGRPASPRIHLDLEPVDGELAEGERIVLYRILQEALRNAHDHAEADHVWVEVHRDGDLLRATVRDDGRGFIVRDSGAGREGLGLLTMKERAIHAGGTLALTSRPGHGTTVRVELPLTARRNPSGAAAGRATPD